ncbi:MAG: Type 1 glutamine amidotransferase-like domain-containing protein [Candidatus Falkowbacteria bacterium]|nr:MAG: Type 1 glutamine amidotransferase-like domain-containing protein [Candidatus Falkowbacteria bacterium]
MAKITKRIFLTSSVHAVARDIAKKIGGAKNKKLLFISTAAENEKDTSWQTRDCNALIKAGFKVAEYTVTGKKKAAVAAAVKQADVIYFSGGNTFYLLQQLQLSNSLSVFRAAVKAGKIYIGTSAGSIIAGPDVYPVYNLDKANVAKKLKGYRGLSLVDFVVFPHWGSEHFKERYLNQRLAFNYKVKNKFILLNDCQYVQVENDWYRIVEVKHK